MCFAHTDTVLKAVKLFNVDKGFNHQIVVHTVKELLLLA